MKTILKTFITLIILINTSCSKENDIDFKELSYFSLQDSNYKVEKNYYLYEFTIVNGIKEYSSKEFNFKLNSGLILYTNNSNPFYFSPYIYNTYKDLYNKNEGYNLKYEKEFEIKNDENSDLVFMSYNLMKYNNKGDNELVKRLLVFEKRDDVYILYDSYKDKVRFFSEIKQVLH